MLSKAAFFSLCAISLSLGANPKGLSVAAGEAECIVLSSSEIEIQTTDKAIINWRDFSIGEKETVRFVQPRALSAVLNRVTTGNPSKLLGRLEANGHVFLINPNGIFVGKNAEINTNSFIAQTFDLADEAFLQHDFSAPLLTIPEGNSSFAAAIQHKGKIDALGFEERAGHVYLIADKGAVEVSGSIRTSSGEVRIHGETVHLTENAIIDVSAGEKGNGGTVILWGEEALSFHGTISANGGPLGGDGGFIETSSNGLLDTIGTVSAAGPQGKSGTWLLDPSTITISGAGMALPSPVYNPTGASSTISVGSVTAALGAGTNVTLLTSAGTGGTGDIIIDPTATPFTWATAADLTLIPDNDLNVQALVNCTGSGNIFVAAGGDVIIPGSTTTDIGLQTATGSIDIAATNLSITGGSGVGSRLSRVFSSSGTASINISNDVTLTGGMTVGPGDARIQAASINLAIGGDFSLIHGSTGQAGEIRGTGAGKSTNIAVGGNMFFDGGSLGAARINASNFNLAVEGTLTLTGSSAFIHINREGTIAVAGDINMLGGIY